MIEAELRQTRIGSRCTGKEWDVETGLDYFGARYFSGAQGRLTSPDPISGTPPHVLNPQRWNMYVYAVSNPLAYTDPDGRDAIAVNFRKEVATKVSSRCTEMAVHRTRGSGLLVEIGHWERPDHAFLDRNKRNAFYAMIVFLDEHGLELKAPRMRRRRRCWGSPPAL